MSSRARKKWRFRQRGIKHVPKTKLRSRGVVNADTDLERDLPDEQKMSKVLLDFVAPYMVYAGSHEELEKLVTLGVLAWNAAMLPPRMREEPLRDLEAEMVHAGGASSFQEFIRRMIDRKEKFFADNRRLIVGHHWTMTGRGPHLTVVSTLE